VLLQIISNVFSQHSLSLETNAKESGSVHSKP